jgi:peptidoglycan/LPS O-acetylase OafA/YrhL
MFKSGEFMKNNYLNLDLLRSFAVLSVVVQHVWHQCVNFRLCVYEPATNQLLHNLSFTGVMFFFVHTCLVLMLSLERAPSRQRSANFLIRRAFRIYPLCWATILLALTAGLTDQAGGNFHDLGWHGIMANLLLVQNMTRGFPSIVGPPWSLPWEVQMYLALPVFFAFLRRFQGLVAALALRCVATLLAVAATQPALPRMFHGAIFPPMFIGGLVAYRLLMRRDAPAGHAFPAWIWPFVVLGLFTMEGFLVGNNSTESPIGAFVNATICLTLGIAIPAFGELSARWVVLPAQQIAKYSYGIYLLHVPALIFVLRFLPDLPLPLKLFAFLALTAFLSFVSFHVIEDPLIHVGKRLTNSKQHARPFVPSDSMCLALQPAAAILTSSQAPMRRDLAPGNQL